MKKFFLGAIAGIVSMSVTWMYVFRWTILETIAAALDMILSEKRVMDRHENMARARRRGVGPPDGNKTAKLEHARIRAQTELGKQVRQQAHILKEQGLSNVEIAERMGIPEITVTRAIEFDPPLSN